MPADNSLLSTYNLSRRYQKLSILMRIIHLLFREFLYCAIYDGPDDITDIVVDTKLRLDRTIKTVTELVTLIPHTAEFQKEAYSHGAWCVSDGFRLHESRDVPEFSMLDQARVRRQFEMSSMLSSLVASVAGQVKDLTDLMINSVGINLKSMMEQRAFAILHMCERLIGAGCKRGITVLSAVLWASFSVAKSKYPSW